MKINPQIEGEIINCVNALRKGEFIIFPDETGWSIGCDAVKEEMISKIMNVTEPEQQAVLLDEPGRLNKFVKEIPDVIWDLSEFSTRPLAVQLGTVVHLPALLINEKSEATFRIVKDVFPKSVLHKFSKPVFAAHISDELRNEITSGPILNTPAYVVNLRIGQKNNPESLIIIRLSPGGRIEFIRK